VAFPLPALESERLQSQVKDKRDGIVADEFGVILEQVVIYIENVIWVGYVFDECGVKCLFIEGQDDWGDLDIQKGYV
jgi:hypothetical protein